MSLPASFSNNTSPTGVQLDNNFAAVANMAIWNCTTAGSANAITLTTSANQPAVAAYTDRQKFQFVAGASSTGSVTIAINSLSSLPLYLITGTQAASGDITNGTPYEIMYLAALNASAGGFQVISGTPNSAIVAATTGRAQGLVMTNNASTPSTKIDITSGNATMITTAGAPKFVTSASVTIDLTTTGANGMDVGSRPTSGYVYNYLISNGSVTAGLATATSPTAGLPTMPGGYTYALYCGAMFCDGSQNLLRTRQAGQQAQFKVTSATNTANFPALASINSTTLTPITLGSLAPTLVASEIAFVVVPLTNGQPVVSANNQTGVFGATTNPPPFGVGFPGSGNPSYLSGRLVLESTSFYAGNGSMACFLVGWRDTWSGGS